MLIVNNGLDNWAKISVKGDLRTVVSYAIRRYLPVREWIKKKKSGHWEVPAHCVYDLRYFLDKHYPSVSLIVDANVQREADRFLRFCKYLKNIQELGLTPDEDLKVNIPTFTGTLPPYQQAGVRYLISALTKYGGNRGALLGDCVGLGKTVQLIAAVEWLKNKDLIDFALCVVPASLKIKWADEIVKFTKDSLSLRLKTVSQCGSARSFSKQFDSPSITYYIVNYDIIWRMQEQLLRLMDQGRCLIVFDECQYLKNRTAKRSKASYKLSQQAEYVVEMSATFLENTIEDLFNVMRVLNDKVLGRDYYHFDRRYVTRNFWGQPVGYHNLKEVHERISPFIIRRRKEEARRQLAGLIADKIIETDIIITLSQEHRRVYREVQANVTRSLKDLEKADKIRHAELLPLLMYLREAALSTGLVGADPSVSSKLNYLKEFVDGFDPEAKIVIFCFFVKMVEEIAEALTSKGYSCYTVHGQNTTKTQRSRIVKDFLSDDTRILVTSDVLKEGQDLYSAAYLVNFDLLWNPRAMDQRRGRIDRVGQQNEILYIYNMISEDTVEERMKEVLKQKDDLFVEIAEGGQRSTRLTTKVLKGLLDMEVKR